MNSYNDRLHSSVVSSLSALELELQNIEAQRNATLFSLYYAQDAQIKAAEKLEISTAQYTLEKQIQVQVIIDGNVSTNVLATANHAKSYTDKSVTNTAIAAANVQVATNAILKLASVIGSVFNIIKAADFDGDLYVQSKKAYELINDTAYTAEKASELSMTASVSIAEVTSTNLYNKATETDVSIKDLLRVLTTQFNDTTGLLATQNAALASANTVEKKAEGVLEDNSVIYEAAETAYKLSNDVLNLNLTVTTPVTIGNHDNFTVSFNTFESAFKARNSEKTPKKDAQPVESYNIMLVESSKRNTFSINAAEAILEQNLKERYVPITPGTANTTNVQKIYVQGVSTVEKPVLKDSSGKSLELGKKYSVFVLTIFTMDYKKVINTFDDYLSAPSKMFMLQKQLNAANANTILEKVVLNKESTTAAPAYQVINFGVFEKADYMVDYRCVFLPNNPNLINGLLTVEAIDSLENNVQQLEKIEHIYDLEIAMITNKIQLVTINISKLKSTISENLKKIDNTETKATIRKKLASENADNNKSLEKEERYIKRYESSIATLKTIKNAAIKKININTDVQSGLFFNLTTAQEITAGNYTVATPTTTDNSLSDYILKSVENIVKDIEAIDALKRSKTKKAIAIKTDVKPIVLGEINCKNTSNIQVLIGNIRGTRNAVLQGVLTDLNTSKLKGKLQNAIHTFLENCNQLIIDLQQVLEGYTYNTMEVTLAAETTDNFGNRLINNNIYIPTVISITNNTDKTVNTEFINALSDFNSTVSITYANPYANPDKIVAFSQLTTTN